MKMKQTKGITLIALVITIIVLLILAGVSIAMLTGDNGILTKATEAKEKTTQAENDEKVRLAIGAARDNEGNFSQDLLKEELKKQGIDESKIDTTSPDQTIVTTPYGTKYTINNKGTITEKTTGGTTPSTPETPKDDKVDYGTKTPAEDKRTVIEQATAAKPEGSTIDSSTNENAGIVMKDSNENEWVWVEVPATVFTTATSSMDYDNIKADLIAYASDYREGSKGQGYNWTDEWYDRCGLTPEEYTNKYQTMLSSVYTNKGFYIGRYEAGIKGSDTDTSLARYKRTEITAESPKAVNKKDMIPYNFVFFSDAEKLAEEMATGSKTSSLMFGIQWDLVCKFLEVKGTTQSEIKEDSTSWGNYYNSSITLSRGKYNTNPSSSSSTWTPFSTDTENYVTLSKTNSNTSYYQLLTTGASEDTNKMNIYDFAGNEPEWTLEKSTDTINPCSLRGGRYSYYGFRYPASYRCSSFPASSVDYFGFRSSLY